MILWKVIKCYLNDDTIKYTVAPYDLIGHLKSCYRWYGIKQLKWSYLSRKRALKKAEKLNRGEKFGIV